MKIDEYQAKQILARYGVTVPKGEPAFSAGDVRPIVSRLAGASKSESSFSRRRFMRGVEARAVASR